MSEVHGRQSHGPVGSYVPPLVNETAFERLSAPELRALAERPGASAAAADFLEDRGYRLAVPAATIAPLVGATPVVGHAITLRYVPRRRRASYYLDEGSPSRLAFRTAFSAAAPGDVVVMAGGHPSRSLMGGNAAVAARAAGVAACLVDGTVRDLDEIAESGFPVWARGATPMGATFDVEAAELNGPVEFAGVQVMAGDLVVADASGLVFVPNDMTRRFLEIAAQG